MVAIKPSFRIEDFQIEEQSGIAEILASRLGIGDRTRSQTKNCNCDPDCPCEKYDCKCHKDCTCFINVYDASPGNYK